MIQELAKSMNQEVTTPVVNNTHLLRDIAHNNFKSIKFTLNGISSNCTSALTTVKITDAMVNTLAEMKLIKDKVTTQVMDVKKVKLMVKDVQKKILEISSEDTARSVTKLSEMVHQQSKQVVSLHSRISEMKIAKENRVEPQTALSAEEISAKIINLIG